MPGKDRHIEEEAGDVLALTYQRRMRIQELFVYLTDWRWPQQLYIMAGHSSPPVFLRCYTSRNTSNVVRKTLAHPVFTGSGLPSILTVTVH